MTKKKAKRRQTVTLTGKVRKVLYKCVKTTCTASPHAFHMKPGDVVTLVAMANDVTIDFETSSPFVSGTNPLRIPKGTARAEVVGSTPDTYEYTLTCSNPSCGAAAGNPEMIVP